MRAMAPIGACVGFVEKTLVVAELEARKLRHDPTELLTRAIQPALWFVVLGGVFTRTHAIPTGGLPYLDFMAPGILAQSVLFSRSSGTRSVGSGTWGWSTKLLVSPTPRAAELGNAVSAGIRGLSQAVIIYGSVAGRRLITGSGRAVASCWALIGAACSPRCRGSSRLS